MTEVAELDKPCTDAQVKTCAQQQEQHDRSPDKTVNGIIDRQERIHELSPFLTENEVILSDNSVDYLLGNEAQEQVVTKTVPNALAVSSLPMFLGAGFDGALYIGVVSNSPRPEEAKAYLRFLFGLSGNS